MNDSDLLATGLRSSIRPVATIAAAAFRADALRASGLVVLHTLSSLGGPVGASALAHLVGAAGPGGGGGTSAAAIILGAAVTARVVLSEISWKVTHQLEEKTTHLVDREIVTMVAGIPDVEHLERAGHLDKLDRLRAEAAVFGESVTGLLMFTAVVVTTIATLGLLARADPWLLLLPVFVLPSIVLTNRADVERIRTLEARQADRRQADDYLRLATETDPAKELHIFGLREVILARHREVSERIAAWELRRGLRGARFSALGRLFFTAGYVSAIALVALSVASGDVPVTDLVLTVVLAGQVMNLVGAVNGNVTWITEQMMTVRRYLWLVDYARQHATRHGGRDAPTHLESGIELRGVSFTYPGTDAPVLRDVNLTLHRGTTVAIVGDNGAGKTTLMKLLARLYQPTTGEILVDGVPLDSIDVQSWRARFSAAFQDHARLEVTAQAAIGIGDLPRIDDRGAVLDALERAAASPLVDQLPNGLDTQLGVQWPNGAGLSGGQWQKLAIGRGMMRTNPLVLVLDEPTAALDPETEHALFDRYAEAAARGGRDHGTITILVSHRFSTVRNADVVVVVADGRIVEVGDHESLMHQGGRYADLFNLQARAYR